MATHGKHDAPGQLSGYLYQILSALLLLLKTKNPEAQICIERFDDVAFVDDDTPQIMIQTKHQLNKQGNLGNTSVDLWRTINSWCDSIKKHKIGTASTDFIIVTTAAAKEESAASYLTQPPHRNYGKAKIILQNTAETDTGQINKAFYQAYLSLDAEEQENLVKHIFIYDHSPSIINIKNSIMPYIRMATLPPFEERVYDKVIGWWLKNVIQCLASTEPVFIGYRQLQKELFDVGSEYKADSLPIDVDPFYQPTDEELKALSPENRIFIEQLNLIALSHDRLKRCIRDYYNAFRQRSQWVRESLLFIDDLTKYEDMLIDEWERQFLIMKEHIEDYGAGVTDEQKRQQGKALFGKIEDLNLSIRKNITQPFIMRGTFHGLANQLKIGWHLDFMERLCHLLKG